MSYLSQSIRNRFPSWSAIRREDSSNGAKIIDVFASSLENLRNTKAEIIKDLTSHDWAILNLDDKNTEILKTLTKAKIFTVGTTQNAELFAKDIQLDELGRPSFTMCFRGHEANVSLKLTGEHNVLNALAATAPFLLEDIEISNIIDIISTNTNTDIGFHRFRCREVIICMRQYR